MKTRYRSTIMPSIGISIIVIGFALVVFVPDPNQHIPRPNPYAELLKILLPAGIAISAGSAIFGVLKRKQKQSRSNPEF